MKLSGGLVPFEGSETPTILGSQPLPSVVNTCRTTPSLLSGFLPRRRIFVSTWKFRIIAHLKILRLMTSCKRTVTDVRAQA